MTLICDVLSCPLAERLAEAGVHSLRQLAAVDPRRLENMAQRHFPFGNEVRDALRQLMPPTILVECTPLAWTPGGLLDLEIKGRGWGSA